MVPEVFYTLVPESLYAANWGTMLTGVI